MLNNSSFQTCNSLQIYLYYTINKKIQVQKEKTDFRKTYKLQVDLEYFVNFS